MCNSKKWIYLAVGTVLMLFHGVIYAWSIFRQPINAVYPSWSVSQISFAFTLSIIFFWIGGFIAGNLSTRLTIRSILRIVAVLIFCGFIGISLIAKVSPPTALKLVYLFYGVFCGCGIGMGFNSIISTINKWFPDRTGFASGILMMGFGFGGIVVGGIADRLVFALGLFGAFKALGIIIALIIVTGTFILTAPASVASGPDKGHSRQKGFTPKQMLSTKHFWFFLLWTLMINASGLLIINNAASIAVAFGAPAVLGLIISICNGLGRALIGFLFDRFKGKKTMLVDISIVFAGGAFLLLGAVQHNLLLIFIGIVCTGLGYGGSPPITSAYINSEFGSKYFPVNFSLGSFSLVPASIIGPMVSSKLIEHSNGNYETSFILIIILAVLAFLLWLGLYKK
ncbi:MAG TPA: MFS transporter [Anaerovoracaceae bacterium]|nr:MFS transporter [Anaerovoracaceae bacterium]